MGVCGGQWTGDRGQSRESWNRANLWRLPLDGSEPERLTDFDDRRLYWFEFTPDGEGLVITRGDLSRDAVLIENFQ